MQFQEQPLKNATATGSSYQIAPPVPSIAVQSWLSAVGGTATVLLEGTNDPRGQTDPTNAVWIVLSTMNLSGPNNTLGAALSFVPWATMRMRISAISGSAVVNGVISC